LLGHARVPSYFCHFIRGLGGIVTHSPHILRFGSCCAGAKLARLVDPGFHLCGVGVAGWPELDKPHRFDLLIGEALQSSVSVEDRLVPYLRAWLMPLRSAE